MTRDRSAQFDTFEGLSKAVGRLWNEGRPERAVEILEKTKHQFPDRRYDVIFSLGYSYLLLGDQEKAISVLEKGLAEGFWFVFPPETPVIRPLMRQPRFRKVVAASERLRSEAQARCKPRLDVVTPRSYSAKEKYPLFIALHGWGENNRIFMEYWVSDLLRGGFLTAFMESSQLVKMDGGRGWDDISQGRGEITALYEQVSRNHPVDESRILIGGFSQGGRIAIDVAVGGVLSACGFVTLCPGGGIPKGLTPGAIRGAHKRGVKGAILTGEHDPDLPDQKTLMTMFEAAGLDCRLTVNSGLGHWFPEDFGEQMDRAIRHILGD